MPRRPNGGGFSLPRIARRRVTVLFLAIGLFALFSLLFSLPGEMPETPNISKSLADHNINLPNLPKLPDLPKLPKLSNPLAGSLPSLFRPPAHAPPVQKNSTSEGSSWYSNWNWLRPFSSSITLDENRSLLPPIQERPAVYCYYDTSVHRDAKTKEAESELLLTWRRAWWAQGFRPVILSAAEAMNNPLYDELQRLEVESTFKKDLMRWLAWENMNGGILAHYRLFPMGNSQDPLLAFMRRGEFPTLTRWEGLSDRLFVGSKQEITAVLTKALRTKKTKETKGIKGTNKGVIKGVISAVDEKDITVDTTPAALAYYDTNTVEQKFKKVAEQISSDYTSGLKSLNRLINAHLQSAWQVSFKKGIAVMKPLPKHTTRLVQPAQDLAETLSTCPDSPMPDSCPPNNPKCTPCKKAMTIASAPSYKNTSDVFTIGTVPHPYTIQSLNSQREYLNISWIREESSRDLWLYETTKDLLGENVMSESRLLKFKEAVAGDQARYNSIWFAAEREVPRDLDWWFGFDLAKPVDNGEEAAKKLEEAAAKGKPAAGKTQKRAETDITTTPGTPGSIKEDVGDREQYLLEKARAMRNTKDKDDIRIRDAVEAWNLADTEAWKFTKAFMARSRVERKKWEQEESKYAEGVGRDKEAASSSWTSRWKDDA